MSCNAFYLHELTWHSPTPDTSSEDNGTFPVAPLHDQLANDNSSVILPVAPLHDQLANDNSSVILDSLLGVAAVAALALLCVAIAVVRIRRKRAPLKDRMNKPPNSRENHYIGLSAFDRVDDSINVYPVIQDSPADGHPTQSRGEACRAHSDAGGTDCVIDDEYASHWYEDADGDVDACCARTDDKPCEPGKEEYDYAYDVPARTNTSDATDQKSDHYESFETDSPYDYAYGGVTVPVDRPATRKVRLPDSMDGYLTPVPVCLSPHPEHCDTDASSLPSECIYCDDDGSVAEPEASVYENNIAVIKASDRTPHEDHSKRHDTVSDGGYLTTNGEEVIGTDSVYENSQPSCEHCNNDRAADCRSQKEQQANVYMLPVPRPRHIQLDGTTANEAESDDYVPCDFGSADESIYSNTSPGTDVTRTQDDTDVTRTQDDTDVTRTQDVTDVTRTQDSADVTWTQDDTDVTRTQNNTDVTLTHDNADDTEKDGSCSTLSKTEENCLDDSDYNSGDVNRDSANYENWDSPTHDEIVYENCQV